MQTKRREKIEDLRKAVVPIGLSPPCVLPLPPCPIFPSLLPFPFPGSIVPTEPPDFPCFTALCGVHTEEGNCPPPLARCVIPNRRCGPLPNRGTKLLKGQPLRLTLAHDVARARKRGVSHLWCTPSPRRHTPRGSCVPKGASPDWCRPGPSAECPGPACGSCRSTPSHRSRGGDCWSC